MYQIHQILCPTDFSPHSVYAFSIARDLARQNGAQLLLLHVAAAPGPEQISFGEVGRQVEPDSYYRRLLQEMQHLFSAAAREVPLQYLITEGDPVTEIDRVARERRCDLIVVGTYGHGAVRRVLMGSTAERLVRQSPCPVLVVKLPASAEPAPSPQDEGALQPLTR
jgi:nucleotide-binding universal stress UspA family protein